MHIRKMGTGQERQHPRNSHCFCRRHGAAGGSQKHSGCFGAPLLLSMRSPTAGASVCTSNTLQGADQSQGRECKDCWHPRRAPASRLAPPPGVPPSPRLGPTGDQSHFPNPGSPSGRFCLRLTVLMRANRKGTSVPNFVLRKGFPVHGGEFPRSLPQCFFREQQKILADTLLQPG